MAFVMLASVCAILCLTYFVLLLFRLSIHSNLPPGPPSLPIIGNLHQLPFRDPWKGLAELHEEFGPVVSFRLGPFPIILIGTTEASHELLERCGKIYSSRPSFEYLNNLTHGMQPGLMPYNNEVMRHRRIYRVFLSHNASVTYRPLQELETSRMLFDILSTDDPAAVLAKFHPNLTHRLVYGEQIDDWAQFNTLKNADEAALKFFTPWGALMSLFDRLPRVLTPGKDQRNSWFHTVLNVLLGNATKALSRGPGSWAWTIRHSKQAEDLAWEQFCFTTGEVYQAMYLATSATLAAFLVVAVTEIAATRKASNELQQVVGPDRLPQFDDLPNLPYLNAYTKEILRWRIATPLALPHLSTEEDNYRGYSIPANTIVVGNQWAMNRECNVFADPETFRPERWIDNPNLPLAVFGFGRRVCPGQHVARDLFTLTVARLLWAFELTTPADMSKIDTSKSALLGIIYQAPVPELRYQVRSDKHEETIRRTWLASKEE